MEWKTAGFDGFSKGTMENGGQNLYVSKKGVLQRIFQYDVNGDGYPDLLFANSQSMFERPPVYLYENLPESEAYRTLPSNGTFDGTLADLTGNGYDDLIIACQHNGTLSDITGIVYFGGPEGLCEKYKIELPAPSSVGVCAGDFNGDGKMDIAFLSDGKLRVFYQQAQGFSAAEFTDYPIAAETAAAADLDGDGCCDLYFKDETGRAGVLFGGREGFDPDAVVWLDPDFKAAADDHAEVATTAGRKHSYLKWRTSIVRIGGTQYLFYVKDGRPVLYLCGSERELVPTLAFDCTDVVACAAGDLTGNGFDDLAFAVFTGRDDVRDCPVFLGGADGFSNERVTKLPVKGAQNLAVADFGKKCLIVCRGGETIERTVPSPVFEFGPEGGAREIASVLGGNCMRILAGNTNGSEKQQVIVLNHEMNRAQGLEKVVIYLGGEDGYDENRFYALQGHSAVEGIMCDFDDNGLVDVLVCNCYEDAPHLDDGSYIYINDGKGFSDDRKWNIPTVRCHGAALGDFRKSGYLDIACGGYNNRELRIFHGGENGYSLENSTRIVFGPDEGYRPPHIASEADNEKVASPGEEALQAEFGQVRWLISADFNGDGWLDIFVSEIAGPKSFILWGGPQGFSAERMTELLTDGVASANAADLNGNGYLDLILASHKSIRKASFYESYVTVYWGGPEGYAENRKMQLPVSCANSVTVGDYNGNGSFDIYATSYNNGRVRDLLSYLYKGNNGEYSVRDVQYLFNHSGSGCVSGDFNGDGYTDLVVASHKEYGNHCSHSFIYWGGPDGLSEERKTVLPTVGPHGMTSIDPGNIRDRGDKERYTSEIKRLPDGAVVKKIGYEGECTSTSWVEFELRCAEREADVEKAEWKKVKAGEDLGALGMRGYVQYRMALCAKCACGTPRVTAVTVTF